MTTANREGIDVDISGYLVAIKRRSSLGLLVFLLTVGAIAGLSTLLPRLYLAEGRILFKGLDRITSLTGVGTEADKLQSLLATQTPLATEKELIMSHVALQRVIEELELVDDKGKAIAVKDLRQNLSVEIVGTTDVIKVVYESKDARQAQQIVDKLMSLYIQTALGKQSAATQDASGFVAGQLPEVEANLLRAEAELRQFKEANGIVNLSQESTLVAQGLAGLNDRLVNLSAELNGVSNQTAQFENSFRLSFGQTIAVNILSQSPEIRGALDELVLVERELAEAKKTYLPNHPSVLALEDKRSILERTISDQLERSLGASVPVPKGLMESRGTRAGLLESYITLEIQRLKLSEQLNTVQQARDRYTNRASVMPELEATQARLQRQVDVARTTYQSLLEKFQAVQIAEDKSTSNAEIVQPAILPDPKGSTGRVMVLAVGVLLGLFSASLAILIAEQRDRSLTTLKDIKGSFSYPLLGVIPTEGQSRRSRPEPLHRKPLHSVMNNILHNRDPGLDEAYWMLQENIRFLGDQKPFKTLVLTSAVAEEGKSLVIANLAAAIARQGQRVLIIDADLRQPTQQQIWQLEAKPGLSEILLDGCKAFQPQITAVENLKVLVAGATTDNPLRLLASKAMASLVRSTSHYFDYILIDAPPLLQAADALPLGRMGDGMVLVTRPGVIDREATAAAQELLQKHSQAIAGLIVNGVAGGYFPRARPAEAPLDKVKVGV